MKKVMTALLISFVLVALYTAHLGREMEEITEAVVRLHVVANSDSAEDQALKLKVRDAVIRQCGGYFETSGDKAETEAMILAHREEIKRVAESALKENGCTDTVEVTYGETVFPTKYYENFALPAGTYDALNVKIGNAEGQNWWCVLFPPLCFVDAAGGTLADDSADMMKDSLGEKNYAMLTAQNTDGNLPVKIEFKFLEYFGAITAKAMGR